MTIRKVEIERLTMISSKPFEAVKDVLCVLFFRAFFISVFKAQNEIAFLVVSEEVVVQRSSSCSQMESSSWAWRYSRSYFCGHDTFLAGGNSLLSEGLASGKQE